MGRESQNPLSSAIFLQTSGLRGFSTDSYAIDFELILLSQISAVLQDISGLEIPREHSGDFDSPGLNRCQRHVASRSTIAPERKDLVSFRGCSKSQLLSCSAAGSDCQDRLWYRSGCPEPLVGQAGRVHRIARCAATMSQL